MSLPIVDPHVHLWDPRKTPRPSSPLVKALGWNRGLLPNVYAKLSGLAMPCLGWGYHAGAAPGAERVAHDFGPLLDHAIDAFGADRCMFASNFPVDKVSLPWSTLYDAYERSVSGRSDAERRALFHDTAVAVYRLEV